MGTEDRFEMVVENLYKAALADVSWVSAAASINDLIRTVGHSLTYLETKSVGVPVIHLARIFMGKERRSDLEQLYFRDYYPRDEAIPRLYGLREGELAHKSDLYTDEEKKASAAYNEFRCAHCTENGLFVGIDGHDGDGIVMSCGNSTEREGWGNEQTRIIKELLPHIRQFARVRRVLADTGALGASLVALLENRWLGLIQLDRHGSILEANDRARDILLKRDGLRDEAGALAAGNPEEHAEMQRLLARALPPYGPHGAGGSMKITRMEDRAPLVLEIHPVPQTGTAAAPWQLGALVLVVDPAMRPRVAPELVARLLGLTPTESRVAVAVAAGQTVAGTAYELGCAEHTARTHLKRVYRKLGIGKQTELVRRVLSLEPLR